MTNQQLSAVCTDLDSPVFMRVSRSALHCEPSTYKRRVGTKMGTVEWSGLNLSVDPIVKNERTTVEYGKGRGRKKSA